MSKPFSSNYRKIKLTKYRREFEEFGKGKKGILICENCDIFYYKKSWHHNADAFIEKRRDKDIQIHFSVCPACRMIENNQYEGILTAKNFPERTRKEFINLIKGYSRRAYQRDPLDRLIEIKEESGIIVATFTENELASKMARKIKDVFNKVKIKIFFTKEPDDVAQAEVEFLGG